MVNGVGVSDLMSDSGLKAKLQSFFEAQGIRFDLDQEEAESELRKIMPSSRFHKYLKAVSSRCEGRPPTEIYRTITTRSEANTLIMQQAKVYLDTNTAVVEKVRPYLNPGATVWEMGCMNGLCAQWLAENNPEIHVYGTDRGGQVLRDVTNKHALDNLEYLAWDYSTSMPRSNYRKADVIYSVLGISQSIDESLHCSTNPSNLRGSEYYFVDVERYSSILERWGRVSNPEAVMVIVLRLPSHNEKLAFIDALSSYGWHVDLQESTHVYADEQWMPLFVARKTGGHVVPIRPLEEFLIWHTEQWEEGPGRVSDSCEGTKAVLALQALGKREIVHSASEPYGDGHIMCIEIGKSSTVNYVFGIATTGYLKLTKISDCVIAQCAEMNVKDIVSFVLEGPQI